MNTLQTMPNRGLYSLFRMQFSVPNDGNGKSIKLALKNLFETTKWQFLVKNSPTVEQREREGERKQKKTHTTNY